MDDYSKIELVVLNQRLQHVLYTKRHKTGEENYSSPTHCSQSYLSGIFLLDSLHGC